VDWVDDPDSRVDIVATAIADLKGIARLGRALATGKLPLAELRREAGREPSTVYESGAQMSGAQAAGVPAGLTRQVVRFAGIGVASTLAYLVIFALLRGFTGAQAANLTALLITAVGNTAANRRLTFGISGRTNAGRHQMQGLVVFGLGLILTSGSLALLGAVAPTAGRLVEIVVLVLANLAATILRFLLLRGWVFGRHRSAHRAGSGPATTEQTAVLPQVNGWPANAGNFAPQGDRPAGHVYSGSHLHKGHSNSVGYANPAGYPYPNGYINRENMP
jgi:putative flippase GtrA